MKKVFLTIVAVITIVSCGKKIDHENVGELMNKESENVSNAANSKNSEKVFKTNAIIEMKVADVLKDGQEIEQNGIDNNGFILNSELTNKTLESREVNLSNDSVKKIVKIQQQNLIELKVQSNKLRDHILFALNKGVIIDYISINNEELTFQKYENELKNKQNNSEKNSKQIENKVNKAILNDQVNYATVVYRLSEEPHIVITTLPQSKINSYKEINLSYELKESWQEGIFYFKSFFIGLCYFLPTILFIVLLFLIIKYSLKVFKSKESKQDK